VTISSSITCESVAVDGTKDSDGLHLNADGYKSVNDRVVSIISALSLKRSSQPVSQRTRSKTAKTAVTTAAIKLPK